MTKSAFAPASAALAALALGLATPALAQDDTAAMPSAATPAEQTSAQQTSGEQTFSGPWIAAVAGYDLNRAGSTYENSAYNQPRQKIGGVVYGGAVGYDHDFGRGTLGVELEGTGSTADRDYAANPANPGYGLTRVTAGRDLYGGLRAGYKLTPSLLAYAKAGYTNAAFNVSTGNGTTAVRDRVRADGYRVGAGLEYALQRNLFVKTEYRFSDYKRTAEDTTTGDVNLNAVRHQVVGSVGLRF